VGGGGGLSGRVCGCEWRATRAEIASRLDQRARKSKAKSSAAPCRASICIVHLFFAAPAAARRLFQFLLGDAEGIGKRRKERVRRAGGSERGRNKKGEKEEREIARELGRDERKK
jgi:hypothetical protein